MSAKVKTFVHKSLLLRFEDRPSFELYSAMFEPLIQVCMRYNAILDLTDVRHPIVLNCTGKCRREVRHMYGEVVQEHRVGKHMYLSGF